MVRAVSWMKDYIEPLRSGIKLFMQGRHSPKETGSGKVGPSNRSAQSNPSLIHRASGSFDQAHV